MLSLTMAVAPHPAPRSGTTPSLPLRSFESIYRDNARFVFRSLRRLGISECQLEDAVQDVFVVVHRRLGDFEGRSQIRTWLFAIALRVAKDVRRSRARKPTVPLTDPGEVASLFGDPERRAAQMEGLQKLHSVLSKLSEKKRAVFILAELEQMSGPEMAEALEIPIDTVYSRLRTARDDFNKLLKQIDLGQTDSGGGHE